MLLQIKKDKEEEGEFAHAQDVSLEPVEESEVWGGKRMVHSVDCMDHGW